MAKNEIHVGDIGMEFRITVLDEDGDPENLSLATVHQLHFQRPDLTMIFANADFYTDGTDGILIYFTKDGDLNQPGTYRYQAYAEVGPAVKHSDIAKVKVYPNLPLE